MLDLGVPRHDHGQALGLARRVVGTGDELVRLAAEQAGEQRDRALARDAPRRLDVRERDA